MCFWCFNLFNEPRGITVTKNYQVVVADKQNNRIMRWQFGAKIGTVSVGWLGFKLEHPVDVALEHSLKDDFWSAIYVLEERRYLLRFNGFMNFHNPVMTSKHPIYRLVVID